MCDSAEHAAVRMNDAMRINSAEDLDVYCLAYSLAMQIFEVSKRFPPEERYALTSQIRRSSRSTALNLREAWAKRIYESQFVSKLAPEAVLGLAPQATEGRRSATQNRNVRGGGVVRCGHRPDGSRHFG